MSERRDRRLSLDHVGTVGDALALLAERMAFPNEPLGVSLLLLDGWQRTWLRTTRDVAQACDDYGLGRVLQARESRRFDRQVWFDLVPQEVAAPSGLRPDALGRFLMAADSPIVRSAAKRLLTRLEACNA